MNATLLLHNIHTLEVIQPTTATYSGHLFWSSSMTAGLEHSETLEDLQYPNNPDLRRRHDCARKQS